MSSLPYNSQFREMREKDGDTSDMLDAIEAFFEGSGKTRRQIAKKLKAMNLIKDSKELRAITRSVLAKSKCITYKVPFICSRVLLSYLLVATFR